MIWAVAVCAPPAPLLLPQLAEDGPCSAEATPRCALPICDHRWGTWCTQGWSQLTGIWSPPSRAWTRLARWAGIPRVILVMVRWLPTADYKCLLWLRRRTLGRSIYGMHNGGEGRTKQREAGKKKRCVVCVAVCASVHACTRALARLCARGPLASSHTPLFN